MNATTSSQIMTQLLASQTVDKFIMNANLSGSITQRQPQIEVN